MIIAIGNTKGGVGKTTLAVNLAIERARAGLRVWLVDGDNQGTAESAITIRAESGVTPGLSCAKYPHGPTLRAQIREQRGQFDDIIIDVGGRDSTALRASLLLADTLIVPFAPRSFDVWALTDIARLIDEARSQRDDLSAYAVLNLADPGHQSTDNQDAIEALTETPQLTYLDTPIRRRKAFANAAGQGISVCESRPRNKDACAELELLVASVFNMQ